MLISKGQKVVVDPTREIPQGLEAGKVYSVIEVRPVPDCNSEECPLGGEVSLGSRKRKVENRLLAVLDNGQTVLSKYLKLAPPDYGK